MYVASKMFIKKPTHYTRDNIRIVIICDAEISYKHITYCLIKSVYILSIMLGIKCDCGFDTFYRSIIKKMM